jgi:hypothetical protein
MATMAHGVVGLGLVGVEALDAASRERLRELGSQVGGQRGKARR